MKVRLSMKVKLLLIFAFLTIFTVGTYLYYALNLFSKDKTASIYESSLNRVSFLSRQFSDYVGNSLEKTLLYKGLIDSSSKNVQTVINEGNDILSFYIVKESGESSAFYNNKLLSEHFESVNSSINTFKEQDINEIIRAHVPKLVVEKFLVVDTASFFTTPSMAIITKGPNDEILVSVISLLKLSSLFKKDKFYRSYLVDTNRNTVISVNDQKIDKNIITKVFNTKSKTLTEGTFEVVGSAGEDLLCSFNFHGSTGTYFITVVNKNIAFQALSSLTKKSFVIAIVIIAFSLIISVVFSFKVTRSLKKLVHGTKEVAKGNYGLKIKITSNDEIAWLTKSFNKMSMEIADLLDTKEKVIDQLEQAKSKVEAYSQNLAQMVEERTAKLKETNEFLDTMLNSLGQGLMVFNRNGAINDVYTKACDQIFQVSPAGNNIVNVLELNTEDELKNFEKWLSNLFKELIPFEHLVDLGPRFYTNKLHERDPNFKYVALEYYPIRNEEGKVENIVCVATDITGEYLAKKAFREQENYTSMITKVILSRGQFEVFVHEFKLILKDLIKIVSEGPFDIDVLMRHFHTIKGGASLFSLQGLVEVSHEAEEFITQNRSVINGQDRNAVQPLSNFVNSLSRTFKEIIFELKDYIGESLEDGIKRIELKYPLLLAFKESLINQNQMELAKIFQDNFLMEPVVRYFKGYNSLLQDLAKRLGKHVNPIIFEDNGVTVYAEEFNEFFSVLVHVFRNIVDHGIEGPKERITVGKEKVGNVYIRFSTTVFNGRNSLVVQIQDDGQGINLVKVRETLKRMNYPEETLHEPDDTIVYHIFDENFTSHETVTDISGRGVGMSAIKSVIERQGGAINIKSISGVGVSFNFCVNGTVGQRTKA